MPQCLAADMACLIVSLSLSLFIAIAFVIYDDDIAAELRFLSMDFRVARFPEFSHIIGLLIYIHQISHSRSRLLPCLMVAAAAEFCYL